MKNDSRSPFTHGMEIEQFPGPLPNPVREYTVTSSPAVNGGILSLIKDRSSIVR